MHRERPISETHEMYLKTLYEVRGDYRVARVRDLADGLGVSPATVSSVIKRLERMRLVDHERYGGVVLTPAGQKVAECVLRRFETLRDVLVEVLGVDPEVARVDACMMEHGVSPQTVGRMHALLEAVRHNRGRLPETPVAPGPNETCSDCEAAAVCQAGLAEHLHS
jgi:DtxR family Mn-dependent transcriptional regulator